MADSQRKTANLFDKSKRTNNSRVVYTTGEIGALSSVFVSDFTPIEPNATYTLNIVSSISSKTGHLFALYDENKNFVNTGSHEATSVTIYTFTTPSNVAYIRFNGNMASVDSIMLNTGSQPLPYEPYGWEHSLRKLTTSTDTITTLPVDIYANDTTATVGLKGNMTQSGTPTPDNPIMLQGTGDKTANLFDGSIEQGTLNEKVAIGTSYNNTKSIPTAAINLYRVRVTNPIYIDRELTFSIDFNSYQMYVLFFDENQKYTGSHSSSWINSPLTLSGEYIGKYIGLVVKSKQSGDVPISPTDDIKLMLSSGSTALPYEPFGVKIPISSANTTTPVYLGEVETTRKVKKLVLDGTESWVDAGGNAPYRIPVPELKLPTPVQVLWMCSHYQAVPSNASWAQYNSLISWNGGEGATLRFRDTSKADVNAFKAFLSSEYSNGTPVTVWYVLATPETGIVNEPLMKIGDYADTVSGITIPTITSKDTFDVLTTLKPSEVTVNYKGWHPVQSVHEYDSNYTIATMQALTIAQLQTHTISDLQGGEWS